MPSFSRYLSVLNIIVNFTDTCERSCAPCYKLDCVDYLEEEEYPNEEESDNHDYGARDYEQVPEVPNYNNEQGRNKDYDYENSPEYAEYDEEPNSGQESHYSR